METCKIDIKIIFNILSYFTITLMIFYLYHKIIFHFQIKDSNQDINKIKLKISLK